MKLNAGLLEKRMRSFISSFFCLFAALGLTACEFSVTPGGIEDRHKPKKDPNLEPLPGGVLDFSMETTKLFFTKGHDAIEDRLHPEMLKVTDASWLGLERLASDEADFNAMEYYGHGFDEWEGIPISVVQVKVPFEGGYNLVKVVTPMYEDCCRLIGLHINGEVSKSFKLGK